MSVKDQSSRQTFAWSLAIVAGGTGFYLAQTQRGYGVFGALAVALAAFFVFGYVLSRIARPATKEMAAKEKTVDGGEQAALIFDASESAKVATPHGAAQGEKNTGADDLKQIKGIGPGIERQLNGLDIFRFAQIADWNDDRTGLSGGLDAKLVTRARRENWMVQAQDLMAEDNKAA